MTKPFKEGVKLDNIVTKTWRQMKADPIVAFKKIVLHLTHCRLVSDKLAIRIQYRIIMGSSLNLDNPKTFNEKLQWLKLYDRNPLYTTLVDKYAVKEWVAQRIGEEHVTKTLAVWEKAKDIDITDLPDKFVLKTNHDSGSVVICRDKSAFDLDSAKKKLAKSMRHNFFYVGREWPYKNVKPCIFAEEYLEDAATGELPDYKYFSFNGKAKAMFIATERMVQNSETKFDFYNMDFQHLPFTNGHPNSEHEIKRPDTFDTMREFAERLSKDIPQVRVDFYETQEGLYFGEMTFSHWSGFVPFDPPEWDDIFGSWIVLPETTGGGGSL